MVANIYAIKWLRKIILELFFGTVESCRKGLASIAGSSLLTNVSFLPFSGH